jgi:hypothetical protein
LTSAFHHTSFSISRFNFSTFHRQSKNFATVIATPPTPAPIASALAKGAQSLKKLQALDESDDEATELADLKKNTEKKDEQVFHKKKGGMLAHAKVALNLTVKAFKDVNRDYWYVKKVCSGSVTFDEYYTAFELKERRRILKDLMKFVPIGTLFIIPGGELLIPFLIPLFPNMLPTQFLPLSHSGDKTADAVERQERGYQYMKRHFSNFVNVIGYDALFYKNILEKMEHSEGDAKEKYFY